MRAGIGGSKDLYTGLVFLGFGAAAVLVGRAYPMGTAARMGPGYFPTLLGALLALLGAGYVIRAVGGRGEGVGPWALRPLGLVLASVAGFAFLLNRLGLVAATLALVALASLGGWECRAREVVLLCLGLAALVVALFAYGLGLPLKVWPA